jgi:hypothetical protein
MVCLILCGACIGYYTRKKTYNCDNDAYFNIISALGRPCESGSMSRYSPECKASIKAALECKSDLKPWLMNGLQNRNLLLVANCARCLGQLNTRLSETDMLTIHKIRDDLALSLPHPTSWRATSDEDIEELVKFGEQRFTVICLEQLINEINGRTHP